MEVPMVLYTPRFMTASHYYKNPTGSSNHFCTIVLIALIVLTTCLSISHPLKALATESAIEGAELTTQNESNPLKISCTYTPPEIGTPTTFTMQASGGSGNYKYLQNYIWILTDGSFTDEADWTYKQYTTNNTFTYTFVAPGTYQLRLYAMDMDTYQTTRTVFQVVVPGSPNDLTVEQVADQLAQAALDAGCSTDYEKALYIHDWLITNASYDYSLEYDGESGVLIRGKGTCESFYRAYALVLNRLGIRSERATGNGHVWNRLLLDGAWTHVDATWDAGKSLTGNQAYLSHLYFGLTDEMIKEVHNEYIAVSGQEATSYANNYYLRSNEVRMWADSLCERISQAIKNEEVFFETEVPYSNYPNLYSVLGRAAAYYASHQDWGDNRVTVTLKLQGDLRQESVYLVTIAENTTETEPTPTPTPKPDPTEPSKPTNPTPETPGKPDTPSSGEQNGIEGNESSNKPSSPESGTTNTNTEATAPSTSSSGTQESEGSSPTTQGQWIKDSTGWWYRHNDGSYTRNGWEAINNRWYYFTASGYMHTGWLSKGSWYYLGPNGSMVTGWQRINGSWYYLQPASGAMATGWIKDGATWYYLHQSGAMATGWQQVKGAWYYLRGSGAMTTGWQRVNGNWYYLQPKSGAMATGWQHINDTWYYFYNSGTMAANTTIGSYYVNNSGAWVA